MKYNLKYTLLALLVSSFTASALTIEERVASMRAKYLEDKNRQDLIEKLENEQDTINAYVSIVSARRKCAELGIDCSKGEGFDNLNTKLRTIEEEKQLIAAYISLKKERERCKQEGINCTTGEKLTAKKITKVVKTFNPAKEKIPTLPKVVGYLDKRVLLENASGNIKAYTKGDNTANGFTIDNIIANRMVKLSYKNKTFTIE
jgi:hypothetical protein